MGLNLRQVVLRTQRKGGTADRAVRAEFTTASRSWIRCAAILNWRKQAFTLKTPVPRSMVGEESELRIQSTHSLINSSPQKLLARHFFAFSSPHNVYRAA